MQGRVTVAETRPLTFNAEIKSLCATLPDRFFYWGFCFLNRAFLECMRENPTNATITHSVD
jgi:hypothetical protein